MLQYEQIVALIKFSETFRLSHATEPSRRKVLHYIHTTSATEGVERKMIITESTIPNICQLITVPAATNYQDVYMAFSYEIYSTCNIKLHFTNNAHLDKI